MELGFRFFFNSIMLGVGLAMDAFSVSLANGLHEPGMGKRRMAGIALVFAIFQALMPLIGWVCIHTIVQYFQAFEKLIPWIALILLCYIGGNMLKEGATSCWEAWGKEQKWNTSLCHPWASAPIIVMIADLAGIYPAKPGYDKIGFEPHMPDWLGDISLNFNTVRGIIEAKRVSGKWSIEIKE